MPKFARPKCFYCLVNYEGVTHDPDRDTLMGFTTKAARSRYMAKISGDCTALITANQARTFYDLKNPVGTAGVYTYRPRANRVRGRV